MITYAIFLFSLSSVVMDGYCVSIAENATVSEHCIQETEVTREIVDAYLEDPEKDPTENFLCYLHCVFTNVGLIDDNGAVQVDLYKTLMDGDVDGECLKGLPKILECNDMKVLDQCDTDE